jgi:hypothetical protein
MRRDFSSPRGPLSHTNQSQFDTRLRLAAEILRVLGVLLLLAILVALSVGKAGQGVQCGGTEIDQEEGCWTEHPEDGN